MSRASTLKRRGFVKLCATAVAAVGANPKVLAQSGEAKLYNRVALIDAGGAQLTAEALDVGVSYVFNYPYVTTPCFLLNLGRPVNGDLELSTEAGERYRWPGGAGSQRSVVSFAAICAHKMSHPAPRVSFINYRHGMVAFRDKDKQLVEREGVIYCCSEKSVYDPTDGARVLGGPAKQPLATIFLETSAHDGSLHAVGTFGGEMYPKYFDQFGFRLALEHGTSDIQRPVEGAAPVVTIEQYSRSLIQC